MGVPKTHEAIVLPHIENLNAQVIRFHQLIEDVAPDESWTPYNHLFGRQLYAGEESDEE